MPDPFPNELVEALRAEYPWLTYDGDGLNFGADLSNCTAVEADVRLTIIQQLPRLIPRIEQRVIDRLAREAGENPYSRRGAWSPISFVAWRDGAACGVAAERARLADAHRRVKYALHRVEPLPTDCGDPKCGDGECLWADELRRAVFALSPERTTGEDT